ncbi:MAG: hypothetical protein HFI37_04175, partial [Lachnospiraceae bacterium]|nr:hypothetical protein [Lachnospiraceae bacterium]
TYTDKKIENPSRTTTESTIPNLSSDDPLSDHINNTEIHMSPEEKSKWNQIEHKVDKETGKGLSTNDFTDEHLNKLNNIDNGAETNAIDSIYVNNQALIPHEKRIDLSIPTKVSDLRNDQISNASNITSVDDFSLSAMQNNPNIVGTLANKIDSIRENYVKKKDPIHIHDHDNNEELETLIKSNITFNDNDFFSAGNDCCAYGNGIFIVMTSDNKVCRSTDNGINWTFMEHTFLNDFGNHLKNLKIIFSKKLDKFVCYKSNSDCIFISETGENWEKIHMSELCGDTERVYSICIGASDLLVLVCINYFHPDKAHVYVTSDLINYKQKIEFSLNDNDANPINMSDFIFHSKIKFNKNLKKYVFTFSGDLSDNPKFIWYSSDLQNWQLSKYGNSFLNIEHAQEFECAKDYIFACGTSECYYSKNGENWETMTSLPMTGTPHIKYDGNGKVALFYQSSTPQNFTDETETSFTCYPLYIYITNINSSTFPNDWTKIAEITHPSPTARFVATNSFDRFLFGMDYLDTAQNSTSNIYYVKTDHVVSYKMSEISDAFDYVLGKTTNRNSSDDIVTFTSNDQVSPSEWTDVPVLASDEKHSSIFNKISTMFKNVRYLYKMIGTTDISSIGNGTITEAVSALNTNLTKINQSLKYNQVTGTFEKNINNFRLYISLIGVHNIISGYIQLSSPITLTAFSETGISFSQNTAIPYISTLKTNNILIYDNISNGHCAIKLFATNGKITAIHFKNLGNTTVTIPAAYFRIFGSFN